MSPQPAWMPWSMQVYFLAAVEVAAQVSSTQKERLLPVFTGVDPPRTRSS